MPATGIIQQGIEQHAAQAAMRVACLDRRVHDCAVALAAMRQQMKQQREDCPAWAEYDGARAELEADTKERRNELAQLRKAAQVELDGTETGRMIARERDSLQAAKVALDRARDEGRQYLMPFMDEVSIA